MQGPQHDDPSGDARLLPGGVILSRGTGDLRSVPSHATKPIAGSTRAVVQGMEYGYGGLSIDSHPGARSSSSHRVDKAQLRLG